MSPAVGQARRGEGSSQGQVVQGARRQAWRFGRRCRVICDREPGSGEEIKLSTEHRAIMMRTAASGASILRGVVTSRQAAIRPRKVIDRRRSRRWFCDGSSTDERNIAQDRCHCGQCDKPRRARLIGPSYETSRTRGRSYPMFSPNRMSDRPSRACAQIRVAAAVVREDFS